MSEYKKRKECAICGNESLITIIDYGKVPLAGFFPKKEELNDIKKYDLGLQYCDVCNLMQTNSVIDANHLFKDYRYMSSVSLQNHFNQYAKYLVDKFKLDDTSKVIEFGSNDGVLLKPLMDLGINCAGFEPSDNISKLAIEKGCNIIKDYFNDMTALKHGLNNQIDLVTSSNTFAHIDDIHSVVKGIKAILKKGGHYIFEVHYGKNIIEEIQYDNVYHEHIYYYTIHSLDYLFRMYDMTIVDVEEISLHAGSIRVTVINDVLENQLNEILEEKKIGINNIEYYQEFANKVSNHTEDLFFFLKMLKKNKIKIGAYGASGRANILCNYIGIDDSMIDYIIDESPERNGRYINNIPILDKDKIDENTDYIVIFAWNYSKMIIEKLEKAGYKFKYIIPFPHVRIVESLEDVIEDNTL